MPYRPSNPDAQRLRNSLRLGQKSVRHDLCVSGVEQGIPRLAGLRLSYPEFDLANYTTYEDRIYWVFNDSHLLRLHVSMPNACWVSRALGP